jgi:DNA-binding transcriptional MerR regulator
MNPTYPLRASDIARRYGVDPQTVRRWVQLDQLPPEYTYVRLPSGRLYFRELEVAR